MEQALLINNLEDLKFFDSKKFRRIYFGTEFCEKIFPSADEVKSVVQFCSKNDIKFTLVTPWCTERGLQAVRNAIKIIPKNSEVVFNDWGVFELLKHKQVSPVLGRLLVSIKRDPRLAEEDDCSAVCKGPSNVSGHYSKNKHLLSNPIDYAQLSNLNNNEFQKYLLLNNIKRISLDNVTQGYNFKLNQKISASLHYPYVYITTSRKCIFANIKNLKKCGKLEIGSCKFECGNYTLTANMPKSKRKIIIKGNSQFYINNKQPEDLKKLNIDRLIFSPRVPIGRKKHELIWENFYARNPKSAPWGATKPDKHVIDFLDFYKFTHKIRALDSGCGHGKNSKHMIKIGYNVFGIDISKSAVNYAQKNNPGGNFSVQDVKKLNFKNSSFDVIIDGGCFHVNPPLFRGAILAEYDRILKKSGKLFFRLFRREISHNYFDPIFFEDNMPVYGFLEHEVREMFDKTFIIEKMFVMKKYGPVGAFCVYLRK